MIQPLSKEIYQTAKDLGITKIILHFSGGSDEGVLNVEFDGKNKKLRGLKSSKNSIDDFYNQVENWAWSVYEYGGAGEGVEYGDTIKYDLTTDEVSHTEWAMMPHLNHYSPLKLELE